MSNAARNERLLLECKRISDGIMDRASTSGGAPWRTMALIASQIVHGQSPNLYSGVSGILLFLLEMDRIFKTEGYRNTIHQAFDWLMRAEGRPSLSSFLTGSVGILLPFLSTSFVLHEKNEQENVINELSEVMLHRSRFRSIDINEFINGRCGAVLGLLHFLQRYEQESILGTIDELIGQIIDDVWVNGRGIVLDRENDAIQPLCGFAHGAAGIGFTFAEAARYLTNPSYAWLANQVFRQEKSWYNGKTNTWPDFRKSMFSEKDKEDHMRAIESENHSFFLTPSTMNAWCHGAPGIGLSRLRAWQLLGDEEYFRDFELAVEKVRETDLTYNPNRTFTLCHGSCGNAELLLEGYRVTGRREYLEDAYRIAEFAIRQKEELGVYISGYAQAGMQEDLSLFMGTAGIGYFFLRLLDPSVPSILLPKIDAPPIKVDSKYKNINISLPELKRRVCSRAYGRTLVAMGDNLPSFSGSSDENIQSELQKVENAASLSTAVTVKEALQYEKTVRELDMSIESFALVHAELLFGRYEGPLTEDLVLKLSDRVRLVTSQWNWVSEDLTKELQNEPSEVGILLQALPEKVNQARLSDFAFAVLSLFGESINLGDAWKSLTDKIEIETGEEAEVHKLFLEQVKQAVDARILVEVKAKPEN